MREDEREEDEEEEEEMKRDDHFSHDNLLLFWPIVFYSTISDSGVLSALISQAISLSNVTTKAGVETLLKYNHLQTHRGN